MTDPTAGPPEQDPVWSDPTVAPYTDPQAAAGHPGYPPVPPADPSAPPSWPAFPAGQPPAPPGFPVLPPGYPAFPPPGSFYPISGYGGYPGGYYPVPPGYPSAPDPLVTWPGEQFGGWWRRVWATMGRDWTRLFPILFLTSALPGFLFDLATRNLTNSFIHTDPNVPGSLSVDWSDLRQLAAWGIGYSLISAVVGGVGWAASIWAITRRAAGAPAPFGAAIAYGLRNCLRVGWLMFLCDLMGLAGVVACVLPGIYLALATSLVVPCALFQRPSGAIRGTFRLVNANFGAVLGRFAAIIGVILAVLLPVLCLTGAFNNVRATPGGASVSAGTSTAGTGLLSSAVTTLVGIPVTALVIIVTTLIYAEMRARAWPTTVHDLTAALDA